MHRSVTAITVAAVAGALALPATAGADHPNDEPERTYQRYAKVRDKLTACSIDRNWRHLSTVKRKQCRRLRRRYALYSRYGAVSRTFIICKTSRGPPHPIGVPNPRGRPPRLGVRVYG